MQRIEFAQPPRAMPLIFHHRQPPFATNNDALEKLSVCVCVCQTTAVEVAEKKNGGKYIIKSFPCSMPKSSFIRPGWEHRVIRAKNQGSRSLPTSVPLIFHLTLQLSQEQYHPWARPLLTPTYLRP